MPKVNIGIICGDSRDRLTEQCIESLAKTEAINPELASVTVLANDINDETCQLLAEVVSWYEWNLEFAYPALGGGAVTNQLLKYARRDQGEFLYHTASDFYFRPGWLDSLLLNYPIAESMGIGLLGAYSHPYHRSNSIVGGLGGFDIHFKDAVAAGSWFLKWKTWDKFGPLNELHKGVYVGSEDTEFNFRLIAANVGRATLVPEMVIHTGRTNSIGNPTIGAEFMFDVPGVIIE